MTKGDLLVRLERFKAPNHPPARRSERSYLATLSLAKVELERLVRQHAEILLAQGADMAIECRLIRDSIQFWLRRYQQYVIQEGSKPHYCEIGISKDDAVFEHLLPIAVVRDLILASALTIDEALHTPTCLLSEESDQRLRVHGLVKSTPDAYHFGTRYTKAGIVLAFNGEDSAFALDKWTLDDHFRRFGVE